MNTQGRSEETESGTFMISRRGGVYKVKGTMDVRI
jgi:hypothetical protein